MHLWRIILVCMKAEDGGVDPIISVAMIVADSESKAVAKAFRSFATDAIDDYHVIVDDAWPLPERDE